LLQSLATGTGLLDAVAVVFEHAPHRVTGSGVVVHHQDPVTVPHPSSSGSAMGRTTWNSEPWPTTLCTPTLPPSSSAKRRHRARPRPVPRRRFWIGESTSM